MRGRKPLPTALHEMHGNPSKMAPRLTEPKPIGDAADPPDFLSDSQKTGWDYALQHSAPGLLKLIDRNALTAFVIAEDLHRAAVIEQNKIGLVITTATGAMVQSPYLPIINKQALIMVKLASELGFTPASRPRLSVAQPPGKGYHGDTDGGPPNGLTLEKWLADDSDAATVQ